MCLCFSQSLSIGLNSGFPLRQLMMCSHSLPYFFCLIYPQPHKKTVCIQPAAQGMLCRRTRWIHSPTEKISLSLTFIGKGSTFLTSEGYRRHKSAEVSYQLRSCTLDVGCLSMMTSGLSTLPLLTFLHLPLCPALLAVWGEFKVRTDCLILPLPT